MSGFPATEVVLVRAPPGSAQARHALEYLRSGTESCSRLVFLHGPGVDLIAAGVDDAWRLLPAAGGAEWMVCKSAWRRRHLDALPGGWEPGSLAIFWDRAAAADRLISFGAGP